MAQTVRHRRKINYPRFLLFLAVVIFAVSSPVMVAVLHAQYGEPEPREPIAYQIAYNRTEKKRTKRDIQYIVIHETSNTEKGADAMNHYTFFNRANQGSSADFFVDDQGPLQVNDYYTYYTWHCGDGNGQHGITNQNSIGVEICVNADGNYKKAVSYTRELVKQLMEELDIPADHVVRHYDASGKLCPSRMQEDDWAAWDAFHDSLD